jgi:dihydroflavonol-4-reductase
VGPAFEFKIGGSCDLWLRHEENVMTVLVTGAAGHLGGNLVRALLGQGRSVRVLIHHDRRAVQDLDIEIVQGDVRDLAGLERAFQGCEVVYHLAAAISLGMKDWPRLDEINVRGTRNVVQACLEAGVRRLIHVSSVHALEQRPLSLPVDERRPLAESTKDPPYVRSKAAADREVWKGIDRGLDSVILYPSGMIGPHDYKPSYFGEVLWALARGKLPALVGGGYDWVDVRDVCQGAIHAEARAGAGESVVLSGHWRSLPELAATIEDLTKIRAPRLVVPIWLAKVGLPVAPLIFRLESGRSLYTRASLFALRSNPRVSYDKATKVLGYRPRPIEHTIADTIRWFERHAQIAARSDSKPTERG